jgi:UDP:flavonoid glycosyltransferase YjiC (YdhE family)
MATLAEALEVGVWGSKKSAPYPEAQELGAAVEQVLRSDKMAARARELAEVVAQKGEGRDRAVEAIVQILAEEGEGDRKL